MNKLISISLCFILLSLAVTSVFSEELLQSKKRTLRMELHIGGITGLGCGLYYYPKAEYYNFIISYGFLVLGSIGAAGTSSFGININPWDSSTSFNFIHHNSDLFREYVSEKGILELEHTGVAQIVELGVSTKIWGGIYFDLGYLYSYSQEISTYGNFAIKCIF